MSEVATGRPSLPGRVAIVTGGSSGIGFAVARALLREAVHVVLVGRNLGRLQLAARELAGKCEASADILPLSADVRDAQAMQAVAAQSLARFGAIQILVACAGVGRGPAASGPIGRPVAQTTTEEWDAVLDTNLRGTFLSNRAVLPAMIAARRGDIVNVSSSRAGVRGQAFAAPYSASKFGIIGMSEALADEVRRFNIRVQVVLPEVTNTPLLTSTTIVSRFSALLEPSRVADAIVALIAQPPDTLMIRPFIAPWTASMRTGV